MRLKCKGGCGRCIKGAKQKRRSRILFSSDTGIMMNIDGCSPPQTKTDGLCVENGYSILRTDR